MEDLDSLKHDPAVLKVYGQYVKLRKEGNKFVGLCPLHYEKSGSFTVFADMLWSDFGGCGSGNIFQLVERKEGISFKEAVQRVKDIIGVGPSKYAEQAAAVDRVFKPAVPDAAKSYKVFSLQEYGVYERNLANSKEAQAWLAGRGISLETAQRLHTGFRQDVKGLAGEKNQDISAAGWICFPTVSGTTVTSIKYRSIVRKSFTKQPGMATDLFNAETIDPFSDVYLVEGEVDALTLEDAGYRAVSIASASTSLTPEQKDKLLSANRVVLAGDVDQAGDAAMQKIWRELPERTYKLDWPGGVKDGNQMFLETCKGDKATFVQKMDELTRTALKQPMQDVYDLQSVLLAGNSSSLSDHPLRLRLPWAEIDQMAVLLPGSVTTVVSTNSGQGKTSWVLQASLFGAMKYNETVVSFQCEMSPAELGVMVASQVLRKNRNHLSRADMVEAAEVLGGTKYYIGYDSSLTEVDKVLDLLEAAAARMGASVLILDHLHHLCQDENNSIAQQSAAMQRIKQIAVRYQLKFIVVAQPRKANQQNKGKQLHLTDVKGSEAVTSMADAVFALHRNLMKSDEDNLATDTYESKTLIKTLKTRSKGIGKSESFINFFGEMCYFSAIDSIHTGEPE